MTGAATEGLEALARHDWSAAYEALAPLGDGGGGAAVLDALADAAWWTSRLDECIAAREGAYRAYLDVGDEVAAGQAAVWLFEHHCFMGRPSMAGAWLRRARRALDGHRTTGAYGRLLLSEAELLHGSGELGRAALLADEGLALALLLGDVELEALSRQAAGRVAIDAGDPARGFGHLDDAMLLAVEGRLTPYATGKIYCSLITACDAVGDLARATEWTEATSRWAHAHPLAVFPGLCRIHHAQVLGSRGEWDSAVDEARRACEELEAVNVGNAAAGWAEIGDIRRRLGDVAGAETAFAEAERLAGRPPPAIALLRLAEGRVPDARRLIDGALAGETWNRLARARLLPARIQIAIAGGDVPTATADADELDAIAAEYLGDVLVAVARTSRGRVHLALGEWPEACRVLREALASWTALDVPYEVATTQLLLGHTCWQLGDEAAAGAALAVAASTFERLGAVVDVPSPEELRAGATPSRGIDHGLTVREAEVLRLLARGLTNKELSAELRVSPKTIARHIENIFVKIGVSTRSAATAYAYEAGLVTSP